MGATNLLTSLAATGAAIQVNNNITAHGGTITMTLSGGFAETRMDRTAISDKTSAVACFIIPCLLCVE